MSPARLNVIARPIVIAHRGASGYAPEHTLAAYFIAIQQGADYIEPDLVMTRDAVLVARHENEISSTTDVAAHPEFAARRATKVVDGSPTTGWFTEDFTLSELKTLRAKERLPELRPANTRLDGMFDVPTFAEILALLAVANALRAGAALQAGKPRPMAIGVYPETKHPSYFSALGLAMEAPVVSALHAHGYQDKHAPVFIQSFEVANLQQLRSMTSLRLVQLVESQGQPYDFVTTNDARSYAQMMKEAGLAEIARYADAIGVNKDLVIARTPNGSLASPTTLVSHAHAAGLAVHVWTLRGENHFLPLEYRSGPEAAQLGDLQGEVTAFLAAGVDGFFTDHAYLGVRARDAFWLGRNITEP
ncbi:MAG: glycerophosphodiester phosphodiesterase [Betaproteobacteria bacterium]